MKLMKWQTGTPSEFAVVPIDDRALIKVRFSPGAFSGYDVAATLNSDPQLKIRVLIRREAKTKTEARKVANKIAADLAVWWESCPEELK